LAKNRNLLKPIAEALNEAQKFDPQEESIKEKYATFQKEREEIQKKFSTTDDGKPNMRTNPDGSAQRVVPIAKQGEFQQALEDLEKNYPEVVDAFKKHAESVQEMLQEEEEVEVRLIDLDTIPDKELAQMEFNVLMPFIKDTDDDDKDPGLKRVK